MHKVFLGIGGNLGNKQANFRNAEVLIEKLLGNIVLKSSVYEAPPWGFHAQDNFWNAVFVIETSMMADELIWRIHEIEDKFYKESGNERYASREMDIDILYFDDVFYESKELIIPHPKIHERKFVLIPLVEIAPDLKHPLLRLTSIEMLENCKDKSIIFRVGEV